MKFRCSLLLCLLVLTDDRLREVSAFLTPTTPNTPTSLGFPSCSAAFISHRTVESSRLFAKTKKKPDTNKPPPPASASMQNSNEEEENLNWMQKTHQTFEMNSEGELVEAGGDGDGADEGKSSEPTEYNIGISGVSFQTGSLSQQFYTAMTSQRSSSSSTPEMDLGYKLLALDFTAKEATRAALKQNGFLMKIAKGKEDDVDQWGQVDTIQLLDPRGKPVGKPYDSWEGAVEKWRPGQGFSFVVRNVLCQPIDLGLEDVLTALDPDGSLTEQAEASGMALPTEELQTLKDLAYELTRRTQEPPLEARSEDDVFAGTMSKGYNVISRRQLSREAQNPDGTDQDATILHVMDACVSHGVLIVDLADGGENYELVEKVADMWSVAGSFFEMEQEQEENLAPMSSIPASPYAKMGYANMQNGMRFLETRIERQSGKVVPDEIDGIAGDGGADKLGAAFRVFADIGKDVIRIATAASSVENEGFRGDDDMVRASESAVLMADELVDDGTMLEGLEEADQGLVSMSPHRLCSYSHLATGDDGGPRELFGAHTDSSFVTIVPVAAVSGLEVFDDAASEWYRPELKARAAWEAEQTAKGRDSSGPVDGALPWHARYALVLPGEFLQIVTRNEITASVHRVVVEGSDTARLSCPILLRGRPGVPMSVDRYLGDVNYSLLSHVNGKNMQEIHDQLQPGAN